MRAFLLFLQSFRNRDDWTSVSTHRHPLAYAFSYALSCLPHLRPHLRWLALVADEPVVREALRYDRRLLERWQHRYLSRRFSRGERLERVYDHFRFVASRLPTSLLMTMYGHGRVVVARVALDDGGVLELAWQPPVRRTCEGELDMVLSIDGVRLYSLTTAFAPSRGALWVGCVQGPRSDDAQALDTLRWAQKRCHGLRPRHLLLSMAGVLARQYGLASILGTSDAMHPFRGTGKLKVSYDVIWTEAGAERCDNGLFVARAADFMLRPKVVRTTHRAAYERREALRFRMTRDFLDTLVRPGYEREEGLRMALERAGRPALSSSVFESC